MNAAVFVVVMGLLVLIANALVNAGVFRRQPRSPAPELAPSPYAPLPVQPARRPTWTAGETEITRYVPKAKLPTLMGFNPSGSSKGAVKAMAVESIGRRVKLFQQSHAAESFNQRAKRSLALLTREANVDMRELGFTTPVKRQRGCGSCVAFGCCAAIEATYLRRKQAKGLNLDLSEAHLFFCYGKSAGRHCFNGWWLAATDTDGEGASGALDTIVQGGLALEDDFPYNTGEQDCTQYLNPGWEDRSLRLASYHHIEDIHEMQSWIQHHGALASGFTCYDDIDSYTGGIYEPVTDAPIGGHAIAVVGYNDHEQWWLIKNSWGENWGEEGYMRMSYATAEENGLLSFMAGIGEISGGFESALHNDRKSHAYERSGNCRSCRGVII